MILGVIWTMNRLKPDVDVILNILTRMRELQPHSSFIESLLNQYIERGGLSKKQLQGLQSKCLKIGGIPVAHLATLEAIILKKPTRFKSEKPTISSEEKKDDNQIETVKKLLQKFPTHKRLLFLLSKAESREQLQPIEIAEIQKFNKLLS